MNSAGTAMHQETFNVDRPSIADRFPFIPISSCGGTGNNPENSTNGFQFEKFPQLYSFFDLAPDKTEKGEMTARHKCFFKDDYQCSFNRWLKQVSREKAMWVYMLRRKYKSFLQYYTGNH